jgi:hypothetical protein
MPEMQTTPQMRLAAASTLVCAALLAMRAMLAQRPPAIISRAHSWRLMNSWTRHSPAAGVTYETAEQCGVPDRAAPLIAPGPCTLVGRTPEARARRRATEIWPIYLLSYFTARPRFCSAIRRATRSTAPTNKVRFLIACSTIQSHHPHGVPPHDKDTVCRSEA